MNMIAKNKFLVISIILTIIFSPTFYFPAFFIGLEIYESTGYDVGIVVLLLTFCSSTMLWMLPYILKVTSSDKERRKENLLKALRVTFALAVSLILLHIAINFLFSI